MDIRGGNLSGVAILDKYRVPNAPTIGSPSQVDTTTVSISFTAPSFNGNSNIISYTAVSTPGNLTGTVTQSGSGSVSVTGLTTGVSYTFTVYATNSVGNSANSQSSSSITLIGLPSAPTIGTVTRINGSTFSVPFTAPSSDGGSPITSYTAVSTPGNFTGSVTQSGSGSISVSVTSSGSYTFVVYATTIAGNSPNSSASNSIDTVITATGGTVTTSGNYKVHVFTTSDTFAVTSGIGDVQVLVVGGGAAGSGNGGNPSTGGGGSGGLIWTTVSNVTTGNYSATIGAGGVGSISGAPRTGLPGSPSSLLSNTGGGGFGGGYSFGGNQGTINGTPGNTGYTGSGGQGGAGAGASATNINGGTGVLVSELVSITGYNNTGRFAGGGAGVADGDIGPDIIGTADSGGGINSVGAVNTGSGGGSRTYNNGINGWNGGSGIVVARYKFQ